MNDDNEEKCHGISIDFIRKIADFFHNNWLKIVNNCSLEQDVLLFNNTNLKCL